MRKRSGVSAILVGSLLFSSAMGVIADDKVRKDRRRIVVDAGIIAAGTLTFNPFLVGAGLGMMTVNSTKLGIHKEQAREAESASANYQPTQIETLLPVPQRPGYYYYPSNPNQLYVDQAQAAAPMQAKIDPPAPPALMTVKIANTAKDGRAIDCAVDGMRFSVPPGYTQTLTAAPGAVITYDSGSGTGVERFTLIEGGYEFRSVENTWRFYNQEPARSVASGPTPANPTPGASIPR